MLRVLAIALTSILSSVLPLHAQEKATSVGEKPTVVAPADKATVEQWIGKTLDRMLDGELTGAKDAR